MEDNELAEKLAQAEGDLAIAKAEAIVIIEQQAAEIAEAKQVIGEMTILNARFTRENNDLRIQVRELTEARDKETSHA